MNFEVIWNQHKNALLAFIKTKVNNEEIANDILQDVGEKLLLGLQKEKEIRNYRNWLFQVANNTVADYYRKAYRLDMSFTTPASDDSGACACDLMSFIIQEYLPEEYKTPVYLSDIEQVPQKKIADIMNLSLSATKSRIQRGRKKLKDLITDCVDITYNKKGQPTDYKLKASCKLPDEFLDEIKKLKLMI